jgi:CelD/BcsL family acetyltransferase involved in cellulose biosynthesis
MQLAVIEDLGEFLELEPEWDVLLSESNQNSPYLEHHRVRAWCVTHGAGSRLAIVTVRSEHGELLGVSPAYRAQTGRLPMVSSLRLLCDEGTGYAGLTAFAKASVQEEAPHALTQHLLRRMRWQMLELNAVEQGSPFLDELARAQTVRVRENAGVSSRIALPRDWESYLRVVKSTERRRIGRMQRRVFERGGSFELVSNAEELPGALDDLDDIQRRRLTRKFGREYSESVASHTFALETRAGIRSAAATDPVPVWQPRARRRVLAPWCLQPWQV